MLSAIRITRTWLLSITPIAVLIQDAILSCVSLSSQYPIITLRLLFRRVKICPNSRSPWAAWFSFMKSISIVSYGISRLNCVWRWSNGFLSSFRPKIHDFAGEKVWHHVITPAQFSSVFASLNVFLITSFVIKVGFQMISYGRIPESFKAFTIIFECSATCARHSSPYKSWEPVQNQNL